jgi:hypothetical protein
VDATAVLTEVLDRGATFRSHELRDRLPEPVKADLAKRIVRAEGSFTRFHLQDAIWVASVDVDVIETLFGSATSREPRNDQQLGFVAYMADREDARNVIGALEPRDDGSNYRTLVEARAWLAEEESVHTRRIQKMTSRFRFPGVMMLVRRAEQGDVAAFRSLLDMEYLGAFPGSEDNVATARYADQRWRGSEFQANANGIAAISVPRRQIGGSAEVWQRWFRDSLQSTGGAWWASNRGLLDYDADSGKYIIRSLP